MSTATEHRITPAGAVAVVAFYLFKIAGAVWFFGWLL